MTGKTNYITGYSTHDTFAGEIYASDFYTENGRSKNIVDRIASDWKFDKWCMNTYENKNRFKGE